MINKYMTEEETLSKETLRRILQKFCTTDMTNFKFREKYYQGKHAVLNRRLDEGLPNNKVIANFVQTICRNLEGYAVGIPVTYSGDNIEEILEVMKYNDYNEEDSQLYLDGLIYGRGVEISYIDQEGKSRFRTLKPYEVIPVVSADLEENLKFAIRLIRDEIYDNNTQQDVYYVEVYDNALKTVYKSTPGWNSFEFMYEEPHHFDQVPFCFFDLPDEEAACEQIFSLVDAYDGLLSDSINDWDAFCNAYLVLKGMTATEDDLKIMKQNRCLLLDQDSDASYLTKNTSTTEINNLLTIVERKIWQTSGCVDFGDESLGTASGVALRYRLLNMENKTSAFLSRFKRALQKRIELLTWVLNLKGSESVWRDVDIKFARNLPVDNSEYANLVSVLKGTVSDETLLGLFPFINDVQEEMQKVAEQKARNMELYMPQFSEVNNDSLLGASVSEAE